jgi:AcrR family transcriptional regulator
VASARKRRTAEVARGEILAAAERRLIADGPAGLRLQDLAAEVGISHPAILHHFGSRDGLVEAVVEHALEKLRADLVAALGGPDGGVSPLALLDRAHDTLATRGHARLIAWLLLSGYEPLDDPAIRTQLRAIIDSTHAARAAASPGTPPSRDDTAFTVMLTFLALFGQALVGPATTAAAGLGRSPDVQARFRRWLAELAARHLLSR